MLAGFGHVYYGRHDVVPGHSRVVGGHKPLASDTRLEKLTQLKEDAVKAKMFALGALNNCSYDSARRYFAQAHNLYKEWYQAMEQFRYPDLAIDDCEPKFTTCLGLANASEDVLIALGEKLFPVPKGAVVATDDEYKIEPTSLENEADDVEKEIKAAASKQLADRVRTMPKVSDSVVLDDAFNQRCEKFFIRENQAQVKVLLEFRQRLADKSDDAES
jgi:hypothetical protein